MSHDEGIVMTNLTNVIYIYISIVVVHITPLISIAYKHFSLVAKIRLLTEIHELGRSPWSKSWVLPNASIKVINVSSPTITEESTCKKVEDDATLMKLPSEFLLLILNKLDPYCLNYTFDSHV
jgi:hypothetical protein